MAVHKTFQAAAAEKQDTAEEEQPAVEVIAALVPWADKEERVRFSAFRHYISLPPSTTSSPLPPQVTYTIDYL